VGHGIVDAFRHLVHVQIGNGAVQGRGADESVDARGFRVFHRFPAAVDVLVIRPRQAADGGIPCPPGNLGHSGEIALTGNRKARLDDIHAHLVQKTSDLQLFVMGHGGAGALFAVAQGGVENQDAGLRFWIGHLVNPWVLAGCSLRALITSERSRPAGTLRGG